ncbi:hypothetical protein [Melghirimyces algeriensis]|uniref:Tetratricopeptide repeat-containing protein n=1 Tax=Melghirimyces algeriensis TaxID=910412 RepID=A0A521BZV9_9BACL|nr:hypothetical protein [Melghirimyces algeriensis]SMO52693.1 hypothetical protein SAMN06264849_10336 [Melghirimyces algeriensis]
MDKYLEEGIKNILVQNTENIYEEIENFLDKYLKRNPNCIEAWLRLAVLVFEPPIADYEKSETCLKNVLEIEYDNLQAILILSFIQSVIYGEVTKETFFRLQNIKVHDSELESLQLLAKSWYYESKNMDTQRESLLKKSCNLGPRYVSNHVTLGQLLIQKGMSEKGRLYIKRALQNVKQIYDQVDDHELDHTDYHEFINERIKGIHLTSVTYESIRKYLQK